MIRPSLLVLFALMQSAVGFVGPLPEPSAPSGLEVELRTTTGKTTFGLSEIVPLQVAFKATGRTTYAVETADGWNAATVADRFLVQPGQAVIDRHVWLRAGIVCCDSRRNMLSSVPTTLDHELTDFLRFAEPGEYRVQYVTQRVFRGRPARTYDASEVVVHSNVITIKIIPDDPQWLRDALPAALSGVNARPPDREFYEQANRLPSSRLTPPKSTAMRRYEQAFRQLRMLDTSEAIRARVSRLQVNGYSSVDTPVVGSSRPDLVEAALRERAETPEFGVMRGYFEVWANVLAEREHPELVRLTNRDWILKPDGLAASRAAREALVKSLRELNTRKTGLAAEITATTIRAVERELSK